MKNTLIIGERYRSRLEAALADLDMDVLWLSDNPYIDSRLAGHADLSVIRLEKKIIASRYIIEDDNYVNFLTNEGYDVLPARAAQGKKYPEDSNLCACVAGNSLIHNLHYTDPAILDIFQGEKIHVGQSYARCSCCVVDADCLISADSGIEHAVYKHNIELLKIKAGGIVLDGFDYGFIGGASIVLDDAVLFTGMISDEHDRCCVEAFVRNRGKQPIYLSHGRVFDIGGAIVL